MILALAAGLNFWGLNSIGYPNSYYAAAVKSMIQSWHNFFFVAFDPGGFVTIDKPPLGFWFQAISAKVLGYSGFSLLLPGVAMADTQCVNRRFWAIADSACCCPRPLPA
jgi:4-amino-4-deoxy-L-arabinose transferase-like glycosyltransferase